MLTISQIRFSTLTIALMVALFFCLNSAAVTVKIEPSEQEITKGNTTEVEVFIEGVNNLGAFEFKLNYDGTVVIIVEAAHVQLSPFLGSTGRTAMPLEPKVDNSNGIVLYGAFSYGDNLGADGNGVLATITFTSQNIGVTPLSLTDVKVTDIDGNLITLESVIDGEITVVDLDKIAPAPNEILSIFALVTQLDITSQVADDDTPPIFYRLDGQFFDGDSWIDGGGVSDYSYSTIRPAPFSDTALLENGLYRYGQQVKDSASPPNESNWPPDKWFLKATLLNPPGAIAFPEVYETVMHVSVPTPPKPSVGGSSGMEDQTGAYFDIITGEGKGPGAIDRDWEDSYTAEYTNLLANTQYGWRVRYRNYEGVSTAFNQTEEKRYTLIEMPTGIIFGEVTSSTIELQAQGNFPNLTADNSGIYFDSLSENGDGGINEWIQLTSDTATGLSPNTQYSFQAKARNGDAFATIFCSSVNKYTLANTPSAPTVDNPTETTLDVTINPNGNPDDTLFALYNKTSDYYVDGDGGNNGNTPVWLMNNEWGTITVVNLLPDTTYEFQVMAKNGEDIPTSFGPPGSGKTLASDILPPPNIHQKEQEARYKQARIKWDAVVDATGYKLYRSTTEDSGYTLIADVGNETYYEDNTVTNGTKYYYFVTAYQDEKESDPSDKINLKPPFSFYTSGQSASFWGNATINGNPVETDDIIAAFAEGVEIHNSCIGAFTISGDTSLYVNAAGDYGLLSAYGDDADTPIKDGAFKGDTISFKIWDKSADEIYDLSVEGELPTWQPMTTIQVNLFYISIIAGDVSGDGNVTPYDANLVLQYVAGLKNLSQSQLEAADVTDDGIITALDAALILKYTVGLITQFSLDERNIKK